MITTEKLFLENLPSRNSLLWSHSIYQTFANYIVPPIFLAIKRCIKNSFFCFGESSYQILYGFQEIFISHSTNLNVLIKCFFYHCCYIFMETHANFEGKSLARFSTIKFKRLVVFLTRSIT